MSNSRKKSANLDRDVVGGIFGYWQKTMNSPRSQLDDTRVKVISNALAMGYSAHQLCQAIRGCSKTPHNMGQNNRGRRYNGIGLIFRDAEHIDGFIEADVHPPVPHLTEYEQRLKKDREFVSQLMGRDERNAMQAEPNVIDVDMTEVVHEPRDTGPLD